MMPLLESMHAWKNKYIGNWAVAPIIEKEKAGKESNPLMSRNVMGGQLSKAWQTNKMTPVKRRQLALSSPLFFKGVRKKNMDIFRSWFTFTPVGSKKKISRVDETIVRYFDERTQIRKKFYLAGVNSFIYGDGYLLIKYAGDPDNFEQYMKIADTEPMKDAEPLQLHVLNPECINDMTMIDRYKKKGIKHFVYDDISSSPPIKTNIHPDRIIHVKDDELPFSDFGISKVDILRYVLDAMVDVDIATGDQLKWFSHGIVNWKKQNLKPEEKKDMIRVAEQHPYTYIDDDQYSLDVKNPAAIDPKEFYNWLILKTASVLVMPVHILTGVQVGKTTGAEVGYGDYRKDIQDVQDLIYTPLLHNLYKKLFKAHGKEFRYDIVWEESYVDEMTEANILFKRAAVVERLHKTDTADRNERREVMNQGNVQFEISKKTEESNETQHELQKINVEDDEEVSYLKQELHTLWKERGKLEMEAQEKRIAEALSEDGE